MTEKFIVVHPDKGVLAFTQPNFGIFCFAKDMPADFADQDRAMCFKQDFAQWILERAETDDFRDLSLVAVDVDEDNNVIGFDELRAAGLGNLLNETTFPVPN